MGCCGYHTTSNPMQHTKLYGQPIISQLLSFIPREIVDKASETFQSDRYYKTMGTWKQLVFMLYGVVSKVQSLNSLCKCLLFLGQKLSYLGIYVSTPPSTYSINSLPGIGLHEKQTDEKSKSTRNGSGSSFL